MCVCVCVCVCAVVCVSVAVCVCLCESVELLTLLVFTLLPRSARATPRAITLPSGGRTEKHRPQPADPGTWNPMQSHLVDPGFWVPSLSPLIQGRRIVYESLESLQNPPEDPTPRIRPWIPCPESTPGISRP